MTTSEQTHSLCHVRTGRGIVDGCHVLAYTQSWETHLKSGLVP